MADPGDRELLREFARLRIAYRRRLPARLDELEGLLRQAREGGERGPLEAARGLAHRLHGSSGSYGLDEIAADLQQIEEELERRLGDPTPLEGGSWDVVEAALARMRSGLGRGEGDG